MKLEDITEATEADEVTTILRHDLALWRELPPGPERYLIADSIVYAISSFAGNSPLTIVDRMELE